MPSEPDEWTRYVVVAPDGTEVLISKEVFEALWDFLQGRELSGSLVLHFRNGGVAGVEALIRKTYK
jgi:hypothetical protein